MEQTHVEHTCRVSLLGAEGTGKSSFLAGMALLGLNPLTSNFEIYCADNKTAEYLKSLEQSLVAKNWPPATIVTSELEFDLVLSETSQLKIFAIDYPGEEFREAINKMTPERIDQLATHLQQSDVLVLLIDATSVENVADTKHLAEKIRANLTAVFDVTKEAFSVKKNDLFKQRDICIGVTKCDTVPKLFERITTAKDGGMTATRKFIEKIWPGFVSNLRKLIPFQKIEYFPISVPGNTQHSDTPLGSISGDIQPFGYQRLFHWIADRPKRLAPRQTPMWVGTLIGLLFIVSILVGVGWGIFTLQGKIKEDDSLNLLNNLNIPVLERLNQTKENKSNSEKVYAARSQLIANELQTWRIQIESTDDERTLEEFRQELTNLENTGVGDYQQDLAILKGQVSQKLIEIEFQRVNDAFMDRSERFPEYAAKFLTNHPTSSQATTVREMKNNLISEEIRRARTQIGDIAVISSATLLQKCEEIHRFLQKYLSTNQVFDIERDAMKKAADWGKRFCESHQYTIQVKQYGGFAYDEDIVATIYLDDREVFSDKSKGKTKIVHPGTSFSIQWQAGQEIRLEIKAFAGKLWGGVETVADGKMKSVDALKLFATRTKLTPTKTGSYDWNLPKYQQSGGYFFDSEIQEISKEDWEAFENYIIPGQSW